MYLDQLSLSHFRNITKQKFSFDKNLNIIFGENAQGKTSILESIYFLSISRSFRANSEKIVLQFSNDHFDIKGNFKNSEDQLISIRVFYSAKDGKHIFVNENELSKFSELIGITPVILLSLEDLELTYGVPSVRRKFIDILLSQVSPLYLQALQYYKKSLLQRNRLLGLIFDKKESRKSLDPWDEQIIQYGSEIILGRLKFIEYLNNRISNYYQTISNNKENIRAVYKSNIINSLKEIDDQKIKDHFHELLINEYPNDIRKQSSTIGPHRDDLQFYIDDHLIKSYGSQGENKTFLIALKFIEGDYLKSKLKNNPIFLMDDIFGELDFARIRRLTEEVTTMGQTFITTTIKDKFSGSYLKDVNFMEIENGSLIQ